MVFNICEGNVETAPFFARQFCSNRSFAMPEPLRDGEDTVDDPLGVFSNIPQEPMTARRGLMSKKLVEAKKTAAERER